MQWNAPIYTGRQRLEKRGWHLWFAWYPVRVELRWVWWEYVGRRVAFPMGYRIHDYKAADVVRTSGER